jgi:translation initiation factor 4B
LISAEPHADIAAAKDRPEAREITDWTRKGPLPDLPGQRRTSDRGGFSRGGFDAAGSDAGSERGGSRRPPPFAGDGKERDFGNWERRGPLSPAAAPAPNAMAREGRQPSFQGGAREHRQSPAWGEGREDSGSRGPRREFQPAERSERPQAERQPTAADTDSQWRTKMRPDAASPTATPDASTPSSPAPAPAAPAGRPRLNLAKRTVSEAQPPPEATPTSSKPNPFGAARPIDTASREKEIEEKKQLELRQKKEADDKAREEKKAKEAEKAAAAKESADASSGDKSKTESTENSKGDSENLQQEGEEGTSGGQDEDAEGEIVDDKAVKPQEVVRDPPKSEGAWRRKADTPAAAEGTTTEQLDDDGWSTVSKAKNPKARRGGPPTRAVAS